MKTLIAFLLLHHWLVGVSSVQVRAKSAAGILIIASNNVNNTVVRRTRFTIDTMLRLSSKSLKQNLVNNRAKVIIMSQSETLRDFKEAAWLINLKTQDGRSAETLRAVGGSDLEPTTIISEELVMDSPYSGYWGENILIHEFGHTVMNVGFTPCQKDHLRKLYQSAIKSYSQNYMMLNEYEYWAMATQAWFEAIAIGFHNDGVISQSRIKAVDKSMANLLQIVYGNVTIKWRDVCLDCRAWNKERDVPITIKRPVRVSHYTCKKSRTPPTMLPTTPPTMPPTTLTMPPTTLTLPTMPQTMLPTTLTIPTTPSTM